MVDEDRALRDALERAVGAKRHLSQVVVVADAGKDDILPVPRPRPACWQAGRHARETHFSALAVVRL